jgi:adenylate kinase family enzyme
MRKVAVIGSPGAGKSTFASQLGQALCIEIVRLDAIFWNPDWSDVPQSEWRQTLTEITQQEHWIIDGNHPDAIDHYLEASDTIIFLDFHPALCVLRVLMRLLRNLGRSRPDLPGFVPEVFDWDVLKGVWFYRKGERSTVLQKLAQYAEGRQVHQLCRPVEVKKFLQRVSVGS